MAAPAFSPPTVSLGPVAPQERNESLDILRGWAVFGIILADVDILFKITPGTDHVLNELHNVFVVDKFWPLFSFLFGLGFAMQITRAESRGHDFVSLYRRRLLALLLFGLANGLLLLHVWRGEILHRYALCGFLLLLFRKCSPRILVLAAALCLLTPRVYDAVLAGTHLLRLGNPQTAAQAVQEE
ncbi:MAG: heparan-alpha-glucosaminide N-acetyltransferase domain-containing protein, partial [Terriglobales bacterium]